MSKKFFRPPVNGFDDSDDDDSDDDDDVSASKPAPVSTNLSDDDSDDDDSEEEEEESNKKRKGRPSPAAAAAKPAPKKARPSLFDTEAFDDDDSDEDEEDAAGEHMDEAMLEVIRQQDRSRGSRATFAEDNDIETTARAIEQRHRQTNTIRGGSSYAGSSARAASSSSAAMAPVAQQSLVPSVKDPRLWMVNCLSGKEAEMVYQLMNKCTSAARRHQAIGVTAVIAAQSKGKLYIESYSEPAVNQLLAGVRGIMPSTKRIVPISDMTTVMTVVPSKQPVSVGDWVRLTRGHYKGDLAIVKGVKESGLKCIVQCVPRLDLQALDMAPEEARKRRKKVRPPQKFFSAQEVSNLGHHPTRQRPPDHLNTGDSLTNCDYFENNYYSDGYLLKEMAVGTMVVPITKDDPPTIEELQSFQQRGGGNNGENDNNNEGSKAASSLLEQIAAAVDSTSSATDGGLSVGDTIIVIEGDLINMQGKVVSLTDISVKTQVQGVEEPVEFMLSQVRKHIPVGTHIKVTEGRYANETGTVVAITEDDSTKDPTAIVLTDITNQEISVRTSQLRESAEIASGQDRLQGYELYDLVLVSGGGANNEVGIIVRVGREDFSVVINQSTVRESVRPEALRGKKNRPSDKAIALDAKQQQLRTGDTVSVTEGLHKGKTATIKRMNRSVLFLHSQTRTEHAGILVVRSKSCVLTGSQSMQRSGGGGNDPFSTPGSMSTGGPRGGAGGGRRAAEDNLMGKTVRIQAGNYKSLLGIVCDTTATHVQVELHARLKKVMVIRERVAVVGDQFGATENPAGSIPGMILPSTMATPMHAIGGATPAIHGFGGATPAHDPDASDEVWRPGGAVDVAKDETAEQDDDSGGGGVWGSSTNEQDENVGWGSTNTTNNSGWGAPTEEDDDNGMKLDSSPTIGGAATAAEPEETPPWFVERVCVNVKGVGDGIIQDITDNKATVKLSADGNQQSVRLSEITMVVPQENDTVLVTGGVEIGLEGSLVCVDGSDAILKNANDQFKIIDFVHLAKITDS